MCPISNNAPEPKARKLNEQMLVEFKFWLRLSVEIVFIMAPHRVCGSCEMKPPSPARKIKCTFIMAFGPAPALATAQAFTFSALRMSKVGTQKSFNTFPQILAPER